MDAKFVKMGAIAVALAAMLFMLGCSSEKTWYQDDYFTISGFTIVEEAEGIYSAQGTVETRNGAWTESMMANVAVYDKDGNVLVESVGIANDVPEDGSAVFIVPLFSENSFMSEEQVGQITSYEISEITTVEGLQLYGEQLEEETGRIQDQLDDM